MNTIASLLKAEYAAEVAFGPIELAVVQLIDDNFQQDEQEDRANALLRLLLIMDESSDELREFVLRRAISHAFQYTPQNRRARDEYLRELKGKGRKQKRRTVKTQAE